MDPTGCPSGMVTDTIRPVPLHEDVEEFRVDEQNCTTNLGEQVALSLCLVVPRILLLFYNIRLFLALKSRRKEEAKKSLAERVPITLLSETTTTLFAILFVVLALTNTIDNDDGALGLIFYALPYPSYFLVAILATVKMVNLSKKVVLKTIKQSAVQSPAEASPPKSVDGTGTSNSNNNNNNNNSSSSGGGTNNITNSALRKISEFRANHVMQGLLSISLLGPIGVVILVIAALATPIDAADVIIWTKVLFSFVALFGSMLILLIVYHTYMTINVVKSSVVYKQWATAKRAAGANATDATLNWPHITTNNQDQAIKAVRALVQRLWIRLYATAFTLAFPVVIVLQLAGVLPFTFGLMVLHYYLSLVNSAVSIFVFGTGRKGKGRSSKQGASSSDKRQGHQATQKASQGNSALDPSVIGSGTLEGDSSYKVEKGFHGSQADGGTMDTSMTNAQVASELYTMPEED